MTELTREDREYLVRQFIDLKHLNDELNPTAEKRIEAWEHQIYTQKITGTNPAHDGFFINLMEVEIERLKKLKDQRKPAPTIIEPADNLQETTIIEPEKKLSMKQIALIYVYEQKQITRENAGAIASEYGFKARTSGEGLFQDFTSFASSANRKGRPNPNTSKRFKNKIDLFESLLPHLSISASQRANDEIKILRSLYDTDYS